MNKVASCGLHLCSLSLLGTLLAACGTPIPHQGSSSSSSNSSSSSSVDSSSSSSNSSSSSSVDSSSSSSSSSSNSSSSSSSSSSSAGTDDSIVFFEDFENGVVGQSPAGWDTFIGWVWNNTNNGGNNFVKVDSSKKYSGSKSVHFKGGSGPAQMVRAIPNDVRAGKKLYLSAWVNMSKVMGNDPGDNHEHIFGIKKTKDANDEIRFGQIKGHLGTNHIPSDDIAPTQDKWWSGPQISANQWHCIELELRGDLAYNTLNAWVDGDLVHTIDSADDWNNGLSNSSWMADKFEYVMFGFHSFSGNEADVWMDDVTVSTERLDCPR